MSYLQNQDWLKGERLHEITRLKAVLRNPDANATERAIAASQLHEHQKEEELAV